MSALLPARMPSGQRASQSWSSAILDVASSVVPPTVVLGGTRESGQSSGRSARIASLLGAEGARWIWPTAGLAALVAPASVMGVAVRVAGGVSLLSGCASL